tara:strand:+ start:332 stop:700 length:369 start_codon:yes stop_codon:yes gene_type:complete
MKINKCKVSGKIKLKRLNKPHTHMQDIINGYHYDASLTEYGYGDFRIKGTHVGWEVYDEDGNRLNHPFATLIKREDARQFLTDYLEGKTVGIEYGEPSNVYHVQKDDSKNKWLLEINEPTDD